jgi:hypothetical protein
MSVFSRRLLVDSDDTILRVADTAFRAMLADPANHRLPA